MKAYLMRGLRAAFVWDRVICRLIASWFSFAALTLLIHGEGFATVTYASDTELISMALITLGFFALYSVLGTLALELHSDSWFLLLSSSICVFRWLLEFEHKTDNFLFLLAVVAVWSLIVVSFLRMNERLFSLWQPKTRTVLIIAVVGGVAACAVLGTITCLRYKTFSSPNFDFGLFVNMFHNMKETGQPLVTSERDRLLSHFAVHISPVFYLLLPFYWLFPYPETLQIGQAVILLAGVIPVVLLCRHFRLSGKVSILVGLLYAFYPAISTSCFYDIHENCFLPFFLLWTFYFFEKKKYIPMYLSALCVLTVKEDAAIYLLLFAVFVLLSERDYLHGGILAVMAGAYFGLACHLLNTYGEGIMSGRYGNLIADQEDGLLGAIKTALINPGFLLTQMFTTSKGGFEKLVYFLQMLLPLGFLPFCSKKPSRWLLLAPMLINLLTRYVYQYDIGFQYHFAITAFLFYALIKNLPELALPTRRNLLGIAASACCALYLMTVVPKLNTYTERWEDNKETYAQMEAILDTVPEDASVSCSTFLLAHIADRDVIYEVGYHKDKPDVDFVVLDARYSSYKTTMLTYLRHGYTVWAQHDGLIVILQKEE